MERIGACALNPNNPISGISLEAALPAYPIFKRRKRDEKEQTFRPARPSCRCEHDLVRLWWWSDANGCCDRAASGWRKESHLNRVRVPRTGIPCGSDLQRAEPVCMDGIYSSRHAGML